MGMNMYFLNVTQILPDQSTSQHSYVPQTNRDSSNVIGREILLPRYCPKHWKINSLWLVNFKDGGQWSARIFVTDGRRDLGIGSYEMSWPVNVPFDSLGQVWPPEMTEIGQNVQNQRFFETWAFPGCFFVTYGRSDLQIGSYEMSRRVDVPFDSFGHKKMAKKPKSFDVPKHGHIQYSQYPFESGAVGACSCFTNTSLFFSRLYLCSG